MRFALDGVARVGGGAPIFSRAAAFTADAVLNGFGLRGLEGIGEFQFESLAYYQPPREHARVRTTSGDTKPSLPTAERWLARRQWDGLGGGWISVRVPVGLGHGTDLNGGVDVVAPGYDRLLIQCKQLGVFHGAF